MAIEEMITEETIAGEVVTGIEVEVQDVKSFLINDKKRLACWFFIIK